MRFSKYKFNDNLLISIILLRVTLYILYNDNGKKYKLKKKKVLYQYEKESSKNIKCFHFTYKIYHIYEQTWTSRSMSRISNWNKLSTR